MKFPQIFSPNNSRLTALSFMVFSLLINLLIMPSCSKPHVDHYYLGDLVKQVPFKGTETLLFLDNNNDTITLLGQGRTKTGYESLDMAGNGFTYEEDVTGFMSIDSIYYLFLKLRSQLPYSSINIGIVKGKYPNRVSVGGAFNNLPLQENNLKNTQYHLDSINILSNVYKDIFVDTTSLFAANGTSNKPTTMYQIKNGALLFTEDKQGISFKLIKIVW